MGVIVIADPSLVVLVGAAGSGKSTFAARHFAPEEILSSDAYRALIAGDEADQRATRAAFAALHRQLRSRLTAGRLTVVDATNVERTARRPMLAIAGAAGLPATALVLDLPPALVLARNATRAGRVVDDAIVRRHLGHLRRSLDGPGPGLRDEGFSNVVILRHADDVAAVSLLRVRS